MPYLALLLAFHPLLRKGYQALRPLRTRNGSPSLNGKSKYISAADGDAHLDQRASFDFGFALIFLCAMHGFSALKVLTILYANFKLATTLPRKYVPWATWIFNIGILFANELSDGYKFAGAATYLETTPGLFNSWGLWLDSYSGIMRRWEILFNITVLRLISFNLDYYFSTTHSAGSTLEVCQMSR